MSFSPFFVPHCEPSYHAAGSTLAQTDMCKDFDFHATDVDFILAHPGAKVSIIQPVEDTLEVAQKLHNNQHVLEQVGEFIQDNKNRTKTT